ncbi:MAG: hypothetical protein JWQ27_1494 [Ferruginibacter sp.]|nr:hypothetical protein [Ferruginibacter sp.]
MFKNLLSTILVLLCINTANAQTQTPVYLNSAISGASVRGFYQYLPGDYSSTVKNYPLIIWLHGAGQVGNGNAADLPKVLEYGLPKIISEGTFPPSFRVNTTDFSFIVLSPQFTGWPSGTNVAAMVTYAMANYRVDPDRIYVIGISAGGGAAWEYASNSSANSAKIAALIPFCGTFDPTVARANILASSNLPVWAFHNTYDGTVPVQKSRDWVNYINAYVPANNPRARLTEFPTRSNDPVIAHESWSLATLPTYKPDGINIYEWLLQYKRRVVVANAIPQSSAGPDQGLVIPNNLLLDGSASNDPDGVLVSYSWKKLSGPAPYNFVDSTVANATVQNLAAGVYVFELTVTDNLGATSKDQVTVNVYANLPPGAAQRILIDVGSSAANGGVITNSPNLNGNVWNNMTDARPGVRITNAMTISNLISTIGLEVINRIDGTYSTSSTGMGNGNNSVTVGDYPGSATTDHALAHTSAVNGRWRIKGMDPARVYVIKFWGARTNTTAARSIEIKRIDDNVWKTYNATGNTNYNNAAVFNVTGKTEMDFDIRVKAGSDFSCINVIDITFDAGTAQPPVNQPPVARAGTDLSISLPVDSVSLNGCSSTDPEGAVLKFKWRQLTGPAAATILADTACAPKIKNLSAGNYTFELLVTDTGFLANKDTVAVLVNNLTPTPWPPAYLASCTAPYKIVVVGSSTAYGTGANPIDSSWVNKFKLYIQNQHAQATIVNLATLGLNSYHVSPTGTVIPANRPFPVDEERNITRAISLHPDAIILSLPSNDIAMGIPVSEAETNLDRIVAAADANQIPVWVTTTQPRNGLSSSERNSQMLLRDWILQRYGNKAVDFFSTVSLADGRINEFYSANDSVHLNNYGHHVLFTRIVEEKIWDSICNRRNLSPVAIAGNDVSVSGTSVNVLLNGSTSYDPEGSALTFNWRIINSNTAILSNATTAQPGFSTNVSGIYTIELTVSDNLNKQGKDTVTIRVTTPNVPPVANAGADIFINAPASAASLNGSASYDPDGSNLQFLWEQVSGNAATISNAGLAQTTVSNLSAGAYTFKLTVTDDSSATHTDLVQMLVNQPPVSNAGTDQAITLPANNVTVSGSSSNDSDGSIVSYAWRKVSGPTGGTIAAATSMQTAIGFTYTGSYVFELKVTDNRGAAGLDSIIILVNPDPNTPPVSNAGADKAIQLPVNKVFVDGRASNDPGGTITGYNWSYINGPTGAVINTATKDTTSISFTNSGVYTFRLTVTDNGGLSATDDVLVTVTASPVTSKAIKVNVYGGTNPYTNTQWNNWNVAGSLTSANFLYEDATSSGVSATITDYGLIADNGASYAAAAVSCPPAVLRYTSAATSFRTLTLRGLNPAKQYRLEFYGSRSNTGNKTVYQAGVLTDTIETDSNINDFALFSSITPDNTGKIAVVISRIGTWNYLSGFLISEPQTVAPIAFAGRSASMEPPQNLATALPEPVSAVEVYPNPFNSSISIQIDPLAIGQYFVELKDVSGNVLWKNSGQKQAGRFSVTANTSKLKRGMYILTVKTSRSAIVRKIIRQ